MTCIVGIAQKGKIWMGADTCISFDTSFISLDDPKVFIKGDMICGVAGPLNFKQNIQYNTDLYCGLDEIQDIKAHIAMEIFPAIKELDGFREAELLIGYEDKLYEIFNNVFVCSATKNYASIGSGSDYALGCLHNTRDCKDPEYRILRALESAEQFCQGVKRPFNVLCM